MITAFAGQFSFNLQLQRNAAIVICLFSRHKKFSLKLEEASGSIYEAAILFRVYTKTLTELSKKRMIFIRLIYCCQRFQFWRAL